MQTRFLNCFQYALNRYLRLDPESDQQLKKLQDKVVKIELLGWLDFYLIFTPEKIEVTSNHIDKPDTLIIGTPLSLLRMTFSQHDNRKQFFSDDVFIEGNLELGQQVIDLFDQLEIDWEEYLANKIGDVPAHHIGRIVSGIKGWCKNTREILLQDVTEYIHEETEWFPQQEIMKEFFNEIDVLRMDVDRLEASMNQLKKWSNE